jgi:flavodoxin
MMNKHSRVGALKLLTTCAICLAPTINVHAVQLMAYSMEGTVTTAFGPGVADVSGLGTALDATLVGNAAVVADATRPGGGAGNMVLYTGTSPTLTGAATAANHPGLPKLNTTGSMTMAAWVKGTATGGFRQIFGRGHQGERIYNFANSGNEDFGFVVSNTGVGGFPLNVVDTTPNLNDGNWHHVAVSFTAGPASKYDFFFDGAHVGSFAQTFSSRSGPGSGAGVGIGMRFDGADLMPDYYIDDAVMWDEAADPAKIARIASGAVNGTDISFIGVPEPATGVLAATALVAVAVRRRRA